MTTNDGLFDLKVGPSAAQRPTGSPLSTVAMVNRHLWAIAPADDPCALEQCSFAEDAGLTKSRIKHTNLTGGSRAHCGGELWFKTAETIVINGNSGRYGPTSIDQLRDAGRMFKTFGYNVAVLGYDEDLNQFAAVAAGDGDLEWL